MFSSNGRPFCYTRFRLEHFLHLLSIHGAQLLASDIRLDWAFGTFSFVLLHTATFPQHLRLRLSTSMNHGVDPRNESSRNPPLRHLFRIWRIDNGSREISRSHLFQQHLFSFS